MSLKFNLLDTRAGQDILNIGKTQGRVEGIVEGEVKKAIEIAKSMLLENIPVETICKFTGLNKEEIIALKPEIEKMKH